MFVKPLQGGSTGQYDELRGRIGIEVAIPRISSVEDLDDGRRETTDANTASRETTDALHGVQCIGEVADLSLLTIVLLQFTFEHEFLAHNRQSGA